jgi:trk system potassium uptake protein TrkH
MKLYRNIRERIKLFQYNTRSFSLQTLKKLSIISSIIGVGLMIYYHGFEHSAEFKGTLLFLLKGLFAYYFFSYCVRLLYSVKLFSFLKQNWLESVMLSVLIVDVGLFLSHDIHLIKYLSVRIGFGQDLDLYGLILQLYLFVLILFELGKAEINFSSKKVNPAIIFIFIFGSLIFLGAGLLMLPEMTRPVMEGGAWVNKSMNFIDALFTSASATCVTGLMVEDTMSFFTLKGQLVILMLIKVGGLNIVAFGLFFAVFSRFGLRVRQHDIIEDIVNKVTFNSAKGFFGKILFISLAIEMVGAAMLFFLLPESPEIQTISTRIHFSIFHAVSAFNNAGISLYEGGFANAAVANNFPVLGVMSAIIFIGTLGFITILDLISVSDLRERINKPWKKLHIGTRVGLLSNTHLLVFGALFFLVLEWGAQSLSNQNFIEKIITSIFQVVNRTAGFNSVDLGGIGLPMIIIIIMLMFIGGSSSSTAGGIKTSTMTLIFVSIYTTITGKKNAELFNRNISKDLLLKAYVVVLFAVGNIFLWTFLLSITESESLAAGDMTLLQMVFEEISAFSTVGLSLGVTTEFSSAGKIILVISMFIGRLGTLMLLMALSKQVGSTRYKYPDAHMMIG